MTSFHNFTSLYENVRETAEKLCIPHVLLVSATPNVHLITLNSRQTGVYGRYLRWPKKQPIGGLGRVGGERQNQAGVSFVSSPQRKANKVLSFQTHIKQAAILSTFTLCVSKS